MKQLIVYGIGFVFFVGLAYGAWVATRSLHYSLSYESMVKQTITEMVRPEALRGK